MAHFSIDTDPRLLLPYNQLRRQLKPGDVIAFSSADFPASVIKRATNSPYVHLAIVVTTDEAGHGQDSVLIAESHVSIRFPSVGTGKRTLGAQLQWLGQRLAACPGPIWWAALKEPLPATGLATMQTWLREIEQDGVPYDLPQALGAGWDCLDQFGCENQPDFSALFCSELVARALQIAGVVDEAMNASEQTPADVMQFPCLQTATMIKTD